MKLCPRRLPSRLRVATIRGAVLLEVILALALFVFAAATISGGLHAALNRVERLHLEVHGADLAASALAEVQLGLRSPQDTGSETLPEPFNDWTLEMQSEPYTYGWGDEAGLSLVTATLRHLGTGTTVRLSQLLPDTPIRSGSDERPDGAGGTGEAYAGPGLAAANGALAP